MAHRQYTRAEEKLDEDLNDQFSRYSDSKKTTTTSSSRIDFSRSSDQPSRPSWQDDDAAYHAFLKSEEKFSNGRDNTTTDIRLGDSLFADYTYAPGIADRTITRLPSTEALHLPRDQILPGNDIATSLNNTSRTDSHWAYNSGRRYDQRYGNDYFFHPSGLPPIDPASRLDNTLFFKNNFQQYQPKQRKQRIHAHKAIYSNHPQQNFGNNQSYTYNSAPTSVTTQESHATPLFSINRNPTNRRGAPAYATDWKQPTSSVYANNLTKLNGNSMTGAYDIAGRVGDIYLDAERSVDNATSYVNKNIDQVRTNANQFVDSVVNQTQKAISNVEQGTRNAVKNVQKGADNLFQIPQNVKNDMANTGNKVIDNVQRGADNLLGAVESGVHDMRHSVQDGAQKFSNVVNNSADNVRHGINQFQQSGPSTFNMYSPANNQSLNQTVAQALDDAGNSIEMTKNDVINAANDFVRREQYNDRLTSYGHRMYAHPTNTTQHHDLDSNMLALQPTATQMGGRGFHNNGPRDENVFMVYNNAQSARAQRQNVAAQHRWKNPTAVDYEPPLFDVLYSPW